MTRRVLRGWFALLVATALAIGTVGMAAARPAAPLMEAKAGAEVVGGAWLVQLAGAPTADGNSAANVKAQHKSFRDAAKGAGVKFTEKRAYTSLFNGMAIKASASQVNKLRTLSGVAAVWPITKHAIPKTKSISPDLAFAIQMTGADVAQNDLGLSGAGVRVAVMDTGIDYNHPDLGGNGVAELDSTSFPTARVVAGWDFVGNAYTGDNTPVPDAYPDDCNGHGTHVAGIVGADAASPDGATGVAPGVVFGAYRVFGCDGFTTDDIMIAAMEAALADDMDVLNMSIGDAFNNWPGTPTAAASDRLVQKGMVVVASIGNSGASGIYAAGAPGVGEHVIGVASLDNTHATLPVFHVDPLNQDILYGRSDSPLPPTSGSAALAVPTGASPDATPIAQGCFASNFAGFPAGAVALVSRGTCSFYQKSINAQNAGASAVVLYNNVPGRLSPTVAGSPAVTIPVVMITQADGNLLVANLPQTLTWTDEWASEPLPTAGLISSFSSYGLAADLSLKPDIAAPGGLIFSTYPLEIGGYDSISGTSMASPHVAGAVALLLEANPSLKAKDVRSVLQNSADPVLWWGNPGLGFLDNVHRQGAGMLDIPGAVLAEASVTPGKISLGESTTGTQKHKLQVRNNTNTKLSYTLSYVNALSTGANTFTPSFHLSDASVTFDKATLTVNKNATANVWATITPATAPSGGIYGGYIVLTEATSGETLRVPFAGYIGDYQARTILNLPAFVDTSPNTAFSDDHFTFVGADEVPWLWFHMNHQAREVIVEVIPDGGTGAKKAHQIKLAAFHLEYMPRNATAGGYFAIEWDGFITDGKSKLVQVADGDYVMKIWALKPLSNRNLDSSWETITSNVFTIDRP